MAGELKMDVREKLWRLVKEAIHSWESAVNMSDHIADHLLANGVTVQRWIPVTERLAMSLKLAKIFKNERMQNDRKEA